MADKEKVYTDIYIEDDVYNLSKPVEAHREPLPMKVNDLGIFPNFAIRNLVPCHIGIMERHLLQFCLRQLALIIISAGIGIGLGYAIFHDSSTPPPVATPEAPGTNEPITGDTSWLDVPCDNYDEPECPAGYEKRPLVVLSLDGFRADYLTRNVTPNIEKLANCGVHAPYMRPVVPTYTFPNHYSIATGLFPESHGIVGNNFYDPDTGSAFSLGSDASRDSYWWGGEPIWVTAENQGHRAATYFWVGSDSEIAGVRPTYFFLYDGEASYEQRVDIVLSWLAMPEEKRPSLLTLYFDEPDHEGHDTGPFSDKVNEILRSVDQTVGDLMDGIVKLGLHRCIDIIVLADHGMTEVGCDKVYFMGDYIDVDDYYYRLGALTRLDPKYDAVLLEPEEVVDAMECTEEHVTPYVKWELPKNWHYANNRRIEEILLAADDGWTISLNNDSSYSETYCTGGNHGYDNKEISMGSLFTAHGPSFKQNLKIEPFLATELYSLMADILDIEPAPNNGTRGSLYHMLRNPKSLEEPDKNDNKEASECNFPSDYNERISTDTSNCTCNNNSTSKTIEEFDRQLDLTSSEVDASLKANTPLGRPLVKFNASHCVLTQDDYVTGYNKDLKMPMWVSYTVEKQTERQKLNPPHDCVRPDVRLPVEEAPECASYDLAAMAVNVTKSFLYPPGIIENIDGQMDALITSNLVPQHKRFVSEVWSHVENKILHWADKYNGVNVISGPAFDYNYDSHRDDIDVIEQDGVTYGELMIPTHYFVVVARCQGDASIDTCQDDTEAISFIIPHTTGITTCQVIDRYLQTHLANIRDIELITDLHFMPDLPVEKSVFLKNYLATELWE
ncbi:ectonucleotide pyrophosphatase/phosphodiesterase family member 3-like [Glandiceps talaboti]